MKNNNKKIPYKLAKESLKASKLRNIFMLITIVLSVSLLSGLAFMSSSIKEIADKELAERQHVIYHQVTEEQIVEVKDNSMVKNSSEFKTGKSFEVDNYILRPYYIEANDAPMAKVDIAEGRYPSKINEVLVDKQLMAYMGLEEKLGEIISVTFLNGTTEEFEVTGFLDSGLKTDVFNLYMSKEYALKGSQLSLIPFDLAVQIVDAEKMGSDEFLQVIRQLGEEYGVERKQVNENNAFVDSLSYDTRELSMIILIGIAILLVSVLVIYSIFYISISERTRQFGQLRTLGMTKKQIKKMVRIEGAVLSVIGSIIGITIGAIFAFSMKPQGFNITTFIGYSVAIIIADYITVCISISKPAKIAANISPIEATKLSGYEGNKKKDSKKLYRKLSPISLSFMAARGNGKKSAMTMISLSLAGIVFMCAATFIASIDEEEFSRQGWFQYGEYTLEFSSNAAQVDEFGYTGLKKNNPLNDELITKIEGIPEISNVMEIKDLEVAYTYNGERDEQDLAAPFTKEEAELMQSYVKTGQLDYEKMVKNKEVFIAHNEIVKEIFGWEFKVGDKVTLRWYDGEKYVEDEFTIAGDLKKNINNPQVSKLAYNAGWFLIPEELLESMMIPDFNLNKRLVISSSDYATSQTVLDEKLSIIADGSPIISISKLSDRIEHDKDQFGLIYSTTLGAAIFVIAFSLINLLNTLITNVMARKREFACFRTLGMSEKQVATMIRGEGIYFAAVNILTTVILGGLSGFIMVKLMAHNGLGYMKYQFPLSYLLGYIIMVVLVPIVISNIAVKNLSKKSLVERLKEIE